MILHLIKKKANQLFSQKHKCCVLHCPSSLPHLPEVWKGSWPAEQDMGAREGGFYKQTAISRVKGGQGRGLDGQRLVPRKGSRSLYRV